MMRTAGLEQQGVAAGFLLQVEAMGLDRWQCEVRVNVDDRPDRSIGEDDLVRFEFEPGQVRECVSTFESPLARSDHDHRSPPRVPMQESRVDPPAEPRSGARMMPRSRAQGEPVIDCWPSYDLPYSPREGHPHDDYH